MGNKIKRLVIVTSSFFLLAGAPIVQANPLGEYMNTLQSPFTITAQAATTYSDNWKMDSAGTWHYYMSDGSMCTNAWIEDHGEWYLLDSAGNMLTGVVQSNNGKKYLLDTVRGTGTYGKLLKSGTYNGVQIQAEQMGDSEGALSQSTIDSLQASGVNITNIPNVSNTKHVSNGVVTNANQPTQASQSGGNAGGGSNNDETSSGGSSSSGDYDETLLPGFGKSYGDSSQVHGDGEDGYVSWN